jgi:hypothetical protein
MYLYAIQCSAVQCRVMGEMSIMPRRTGVLCVCHTPGTPNDPEPNIIPASYYVGFLIFLRPAFQSDTIPLSQQTTTESPGDLARILHLGFPLVRPFV